VTALDASAAAKLVVAERGSEEMRALFRSDDDFFSSSILIAELLRLATRTGADYGTVERLLARMELLAMDDSLLREAGRLNLPGTWVNSSDAIYLVTAQRLQQRTLLTYDQQQARAAYALGLTTLAPGFEEDWWR
jgi:predicted nucleic acid-binding protein